MEAIAGRASLVAEMHTIKLSGDPLNNAAHADIRRCNLSEISDLSVSPRFRNSNRIL
jgi:hypothetical protein